MTSLRLDLMRFSPPWAGARCHCVCNHAFSPFHQITPTRRSKKRMGKLMTTMKYLHFSRAEKNNEQEMWQPQLFGGAKSLETAPAGESCWGARGCQAGWKNGRWQGQHFFFFFMLHSPTEAQLKRQIAGAISYGGGNLSAFKLVPLQRLDRGMKISGQQTKECNLISANRCACQWLGRLCLTRFGGSRRRLHTEQRWTPSAHWELIWKGPQSVGDLIWIFPSQLPPVFWANFPSKVAQTNGFIIQHDASREAPWARMRA